MKSAWNHLTAAILEDTSTSGQKLAALDGVRGLAVLTVFVSHSSAFNQRLTPWTNFHGTGQIGVYLFFVLSGFLLAHALLARTPINFGGFWLRRFFRIAPLYYLVVSIVFACQLAAGKVYGDAGIRNLFIAGGWPGFFKHLIFLKGNSVFWTIAAEFEFYFILPFLVVLLLRFGWSAAWAFMLLAFAYCGWAVAIHAGFIGPQYALKVAQISHPTQFFDVFLFGIVAAWLWREPAFLRWWRARAQTMQNLAIAASLVLLVSSLACVADQFFFVGGWWTMLREWSVIYALGFSLMILATLDGNPLFGCIFNWRWLRLIGVTGFSWYLLHFPVLNFMSRAYGPETNAWSFVEIARWLTSFVITAALSIGTYLLVEKPFMLMSRSFLKRRVSTEAETVPV